MYAVLLVLLLVKINFEESAHVISSFCPLLGEFASLI